MSTQEAYLNCFLDFDYFTNEDDLHRVRMAYEFSKKAHDGQKRKSGEPYFCHPVAVAQILVEAKAPSSCVIAALLHDTVEDTETSLEIIEQQFGKEIANLVNGVTKLDKSQASASRSFYNQDIKIESLRKWFNVMQGDLRVAVVKLADRLHNIQTLTGHGSPEKEKEIAQNTLDIYTRIAERLCITDWRSQMEEHAFQHLALPKQSEIESTKAFLENKGKAALQCIQDTLKEYISSEYIYFRSPTNYAVFKRLEESSIQKLEQSFVFRIVIIAPTEEQCYSYLYYIHSHFQQVSGSLVDHISRIKDNGYRGLHTTVILPDGSHVEVRIRTQTMDNYAHFGIITHLAEHDVPMTASSIPGLSSLSYVVTSTEGNSHAFTSALEKNIFQESIIVHGPKDSVYIVPRDASLLDVAFFALGIQALKIKEIIVKGEPTPFFTKVHHGIAVDFVISEETAFDYQWLYWCETMLAKSYLMEYIKDTTPTEKIHHGLKMLNHKLKEQSLPHIELYGKHILRQLLDRLQFNSINDLATSISSGVLPPSKVTSVLLELTIGHNKKILYTFRFLYYGTDFKKIFTSISQLGDITSFSSDKSSDNGIRVKISTEHRNLEEIEKVHSILYSTPGIYKIFGESARARIHEFILLCIIGLTWGLDPVISKYLSLNVIPITTFISLRFFFSILIFLVFLLFLRRKYTISSTCLLKNKFVHQIGAGLALYGVAYTSIQSILASSPSIYNLIMGIISLSILLSGVQKVSSYSSHVQIQKIIFYLIAAFILGGIVLLSLPLSASFLLFFAALCYITYNFFQNQITASSNSIPSLITQQLIFNSIALACSLCFLPWNTLSQLDLIQLCSTFFYTLLCVCIPYSIFMRQHTLRSSRFALVFVFSMLSVYGLQYIIFNILPTFIELFAFFSIIITHLQLRKQNIV